MSRSFKAISITLGGGGVIFEGLRKIPLLKLFAFCEGLMGVNSQRLGHCGVQWNLFSDIAFREQAMPDMGIGHTSREDGASAKEAAVVS